jgi:hypothetical protein
MPYTAEKPKIAESPDELRARIPGWGADVDPADRPSVPREQLVDPSVNGAHWDFPERQPEKWPRERSIEHGQLPPVFGTTCPPRGLSGKIRRLSYAKYSEGRAAHWLLLVLADRVDALEHHVASFASLRPDNPITETGIRSELSHHPIRSRFGVKRTDLVHQPLDPIVVGGPWLLAAWGGYRVVRKLRRRR